MSFASYKYQKALNDFERMHRVMLEASLAGRGMPLAGTTLLDRIKSWAKRRYSKNGRHDARVHSHSAFKALPHTLERVRYVADDLLSDVGNAWDYFLNDSLRYFNVSTTGVKKSGETGALNLDERLADFDRINAEFAGYAKSCKELLFDRLKDARNAYQHREFWENTFAASFPGDGPWLVDLGWGTRYGDVAVMRDARRGIHLLYELNRAFGTGHNFPAPSDPCEECNEDSWIQAGDLLNRMGELR